MTPFIIAPERYGRRALKLISLRWLKGQRWMRPLYRLLRRKRMWLGGHIHWKTLVADHPLPNASADATRIIIATSTGAHLAAARLEQTLGVALQLRGAQASFLLCDGALPACMMCEHSLMRDLGEFVRHGPAKLLCDTCFAPAASAIKPLGLPLHRYSEWITTEDRLQAERMVQSIPPSQMRQFSLDGVALGEHAFAAVCRFFGVADPLTRQGGEAVLRQYLFAAWLTLRAGQRLFAQLKPQVLVLHHGIYIPQGVLADVARKQGVRLVTWHPSYRKGTFIFSHGDTYHRTMISEPAECWREMEWSETREQKILHYLRSRHTGNADWIWFHEKPEFDRENIIQTLEIDSNKPIIGLLTNVVWDAQLHYPHNAYPNMIAWLYDTIDHFMARNDVQLVIRIHPAEVYGNVASRQTVIEAIKARYASLPAHIKVIPPLSEISTYSVMALCDSALIYSTKTGIELAAAGIPVIVAGEAWVRGKGFTLDVDTPAEYQRILRRLPLKERLSHEQVALARRYAYHFFFRRMIEVEIFEPRQGEPPFQLAIQSLDELLPSRCNGLDVICNGILTGAPFIQEFAN